MLGVPNLRDRLGHTERMENEMRLSKWASLVFPDTALMSVDLPQNG